MFLPARGWRLSVGVKGIHYVIIFGGIFAAILANALFGHLLFATDTEQVANKYSIYVHLQPEWKSHPNNLIFDVTNSWFKTAKSDGTAPSNTNRLLQLDGKTFVELRHDFSDCMDEWSPILYRKAIDAVRHEIEYLQGEQLSMDPSISVYPDITNAGYALETQQEEIGDGYAQFIPVCTSSDTTSYDYSVRIASESIGVDIYFVSSQDALKHWGGPQFEQYVLPGCTAQNKKSVSGTCNGVEDGGGMILAIPDRLDTWVTNITVNLYERV